ncbi:hypothetical protein [Rhodoferax sp.]|uniref:hypothetical protein n=1 Tax=Rhodoferax sp. TaxID=50421 RepID=UPI002609BFAF|nr:hypothetical protein [Rhodoferax sp.]MDD2923935.1 hypothetical protein [Rhodoferax sp.]
MLTYLPIPLHLVRNGQVLPVDAWTPDGRLLLRRGQRLASEALREMLSAHHASMTETDAQAWQRSRERHLLALRLAGKPLAEIAHMPMPDVILDTDYLEGHQVDGGWLDLQDILRSLLYQGAQATLPLPRIEGLVQKALSLLRQDPDEGLFVLFQALPDLNMGYCATHALLCGVISTLAAERLAQAEDSAPMLLRSALVMNIGMAQPQDNLARQRTPPNPMQRQIIATHPPTSADILRGFGMQDEALLALVHWHHAPHAAALPATQQTGLHLLSLADSLVAKMAPRVSRPAMTPLGAAKSLVLSSCADTSTLRPAMAAVLGFYPPGSYVELANAETAVVIKRGARATTPHVASIMSASGMPLSKYIYRDTRDARWAVKKPLERSVNIHVNLDKIRHLRQQHGV